ncbi:MAG: hypothetical protein U0271_45315 [Polyangiaceae bacterium]
MRSLITSSRAAILLIVGALAVGCSASSAPPAKDARWLVAPDAWPRFSAALEGDWRGRAGGGAEVSVSYHSIAGGSAVAETFGSPGHATMTLFHPDHGGLVATHYCAQGNQPRLRAVSADGLHLRFQQADITDLDPGEAQLVELELTIDGDKLERLELYRAPDGSVERTLWHFER